MVRAGLPVVDAADRLVRARSPELRSLPPFSIRIRSRGVHGQFGGRATAESSELFLRFMQAEADLRPDSDVLDIGCGCGLTAVAFAEFLEPGRYTGIDVDRPSVDACLANPRLSRTGFKFVHAEVGGDVYSGGDTPASSYRFPLPDGAFSHVILCSVFTHMLPAEVENYLREIARVLRPGGRVVFSTFLTDHGPGQGIYAFPHDRDTHRIAQESQPTKAVAYRLDYLDGAIADAGLRREQGPVLGTWRQDPNVPVVHPLASGQDLIVAVRP